MTGAISGVGGALGNVANLVGAAGDIAGAFRDPANQYKNYPGTPFKGLITTPQYSFGGGTLTRRNDDFLTGQRRIRDLTAGLRAEVRPGFGRLTETGVNAIRQRAAQAAGNLRTQLARRGLAGASFADDQLTRVGLEYSQAESEFRSQAFQQEMAATAELIDRESASLLAQAQVELQEYNIATGFLQGVNQVAVSQKEIEKRLAQEQLMQKFNSTAQPPAAPAPAPAPAPAAVNPPGQRRPVPGVSQPVAGFVSQQQLRNA